MNSYLHPLINELNTLSSEGIEWQKNGKTIISKIVPLCCCVDSPCRCSLLSMKQYNGLYGCTFCYHPTENVDGYRKYPVMKNTPALRTHEDIKKNMYESCYLDPVTGKAKTKEVLGVKNPSILMNLNYFNMSDGMTPDSMHSVF